MGVHRWRDEEEWPLARTAYTSFFLRSGGRANTAAGDGTLTQIEPSEPEPPDRFEYDPYDPVPSAGGAMLGPGAGIQRQNEVEARADVLVYSSDPLEKDLEVTGPIALEVYVTTSAPCTDFTAKLVDVFPDGMAYNVSEGILRRQYERLASQPTRIEIELWPTSSVFLKGHRMRLEVSSSNYPRFDRNPNTGRDIATESASQRAQQTVFHGRDFPSRLILPVIP